jgi:2-phospho-L-lactate transferase/gluconeogenesis factor (CofD/UPF0052 family)
LVTFIKEDRQLNNINETQIILRRMTTYQVLDELKKMWEATNNLSPATERELAIITQFHYHFV